MHCNSSAAAHRVEKAIESAAVMARNDVARVVFMVIPENAGSF
jgi:hypothetical protein